MKDMNRKLFYFAGRAVGQDLNATERNSRKAQVLKVDASQLILLCHFYPSPLQSSSDAILDHRHKTAG